jgi:ubiquinol-cytochrome c reductase cytochrome b subunit
MGHTEAEGPAHTGTEGPAHTGTEGPAYALGGTRLGKRVTAVTARLRRRACPNHWSFLFGVVSVALFMVLLVTGIALMVCYDPSTAVVRYHGSYPLLRGLEMSQAYASMLRISFDVTGGLLLRQAHHWAALMLPGSVALQLLSTFFTGAFRRPRQWAWVLLVAIFVLALVSGWSGYALPDDTLSSTGLRIVQGVMLGIPIIGTWLTWKLFGGEFPGSIITHMYVIHLVAPAILAVGMAMRLRLTYRLGPTQFGASGRTEGNIVGVPMWPNAAARMTGLFFITTGVVMLMGATLTVSPVWMYGPSSPSNAFAGSQPDWYTAFLDGALRLVPPGWEIGWLGRTWTLAVLVPLLAIGLFFALMTTYPFLEGWIAADRREHHLLDRPRDTPTRTGLGVAGMTFYATLWLAGSADVIATQFRVSFEGVIWLLRAVVLLGPPLAYLLTRQICFALQIQDRERLLHGAESGRIVQLPNGGYVEPHAWLSARRRYALTRRGAEGRGPWRRGP